MHQQPPPGSSLGRLGHAAAQPAAQHTSLCPGARRAHHKVNEGLVVYVTLFSNVEALHHLEHVNVAHHIAFLIELTHQVGDRRSWHPSVPGLVQRGEGFAEELVVLCLGHHGHEVSLGEHSIAINVRVRLIDHIKDVIVAHLAAAACPCRLEIQHAFDFPAFDRATPIAVEDGERVFVLGDLSICQRPHQRVSENHFALVSPLGRAAAAQVERTEGRAQQLKAHHHR
mmetsp:Transcript_60765/g.166886  ORF Transcript_60765/g.166886 Transcript_60765/m.166886 type:complete len:227 (-) Transcript_60765:634-1314(-)